MLSRKINAGVSLLCTLLLLGHASYHAIRMLSGGRITANVDFIAWALVGLMAIHAYISIEQGVSAHMDTEKCKCKSYPKLNTSTIIQRASGVMMVLFTALHIAGTVGFLTPPPLVHAILPPLFFTLVLTHAVVSTSKAFITLGIGNARLVKTVDVVMRVLCGVVLLADVVGFYLYTFVGVGK